MNASSRRREATRPTLEDAINNQPDTLFVVAAGNDGVDDNDDTPTYPCDIARAEHRLRRRHDEPRRGRADFSNYGDQSVDLFAPGDGRPRADAPVATDDYCVPQRHVDGRRRTSPRWQRSRCRRTRSSTTVDLKDAAARLGRHDSDARRHLVDGRRGSTPASRSLARALAPRTPIDTDGDGESTRSDACPDNDAPARARPEGCPRPDADGDGVADCVRQLRQRGQRGPGGQRTRTTLGDACDADIDGDCVANTSDNCPTTSNPGQRDAPDGDGLGDSCDPDRDNDGVPNTSDLCADQSGQRRLRVPGRDADPQPADADRDGVTDATDACPRETAATKNGCPLAQVASISAKARSAAASAPPR